jgi:hypothetical protein
MTDATPVPANTIGRRTLLGAAWAAPVVIAAVTAPSAAASGAPDFLILDEVAPNPVNAGAQTVYSMQLVEQIGGTSVGDVAVNIVAPNFLTYVSFTGAGWTLVNQSGGEFDFTYSPVIAGSQSSTTLAITFTAAAGAAGNTGNIVSFIYTGTGGDSNDANNNSSQTVTVA